MTTPIYKSAWFFALALLALLLLLGAIIFISYTRRKGTKYQGKSRVSLSKPISVIQLQFYELDLSVVSINLLVVYRESVNLIGYLTRRLSADSLQL